MAPTPVTWSSWVPGEPGSIADKRKADLTHPDNGIAAATIAKLVDMKTMGVALQALDSAYYTDGRIAFLTANDMRHALLAQESPKAWD